jgi:DNA replication protein DnaC
MDEKFLMIIDARYQDSKPTIFTSNYEIEQLPFNDMRIIDRLSDVERFYSIRMPKESVRQKARLATGETSLFYKILGGEET